MTISVQLDKKTLRALKARARKAGVSVSDFVREAVTAKLEAPLPQPAKTPFELWQEVFTGFDSAESNRSQRVKELVGEEIRKNVYQRS